LLSALRVAGEVTVVEQDMHVARPSVAYRQERGGRPHRLR